jgi:ribonuclease P/MRP protein subunit POP5
MKQKEKMKTLLPTLRERDRYIAFKILSEYPITYDDLEQAIKNVALDFLGEYGVSKTSMWIIKNLYEEYEQMCVIKCNNKSVPQVISCLGLISRLGDNRITVKILKVSGTIKGLRIE